jgi:hypothetical protein
MFSLDALLDDLRQVYDRIGKIPTISEYELNGITSSDTIQRRFGGWNKAIEKCFGTVLRNSPIPKIEHPCGCCGKITKNKNFCSRTCAASINNEKYPKRIKGSYCRLCGNEVSRRFKLCRSCWILEKIEKTGSKSIIDFKSTNARHRYQNIRSHAHRVAKYLKMSRSCAVCGYELHTELCHIKDISKFPKTAKLCEVNDRSNLVFLCCNHHWELDNGFLVL